MISTPPGQECAIPYDTGRNAFYPSLYNKRVPPEKGVHVYNIDGGVAMLHDDFISRQRYMNGGPGSLDFDWIFPVVDRNDRYFDKNLGRTVTYTYDPIDPSLPPSGMYRNLPEAFTDSDGHRTQMVSLLVGDTTGLAPNSNITLVKRPKYINGPSRNTRSMFAVESAFWTIDESIRRYHPSRGDRKVVVTMSINF